MSWTTLSPKLRELVKYAETTASPRIGGCRGGGDNAGDIVA
jgi:hypothetical protein